jgi:DNA polymerase-3 subunit delta
MKSKLGDATTVELNTTELNGRGLSLDELTFACDALPFLAEKRLVIVNNLASRFERKRGKPETPPEQDSALLEGFGEYVEGLPDTTRLVLAENRNIPKNNPIRKIVSSSEYGYQREYTPLSGGKLNRWIAERVEEQGGRIDPAAINVLAVYVGNDLRLLDHEISKLLTYMGEERPITKEDAELLVSYVQEANIFNMVDALGTRDTRRAMELVEQLLDDGRAPLYLLRMMTRQFRILLQVKELLAKGTAAEDMRSLLGLHPYVVKKATGQARNFSNAQLESIYHQLLELDVAVKSGAMEERLALGVFVAEVRGEPGDR